MTSWLQEQHTAMNRYCLRCRWILGTDSCEGGGGGSEGRQRTGDVKGRGGERKRLEVEGRRAGKGGKGQKRGGDGAMKRREEKGREVKGRVGAREERG